MPYQGSKNYHGPSRAKVASATGDGNDYTASKDDQVVVRDTNDSIQTITLPAVSDIQAGKTVEVHDGGGNAGTNNITVTANSDDANINGADQDITISTNYAVHYFTYTGSEWLTQNSVP